ncbi:acyltransferase family protein [Sphingomonas sp. M1-B02]|uniref:acyltransferase family protein n=1 Tax=Sphingomonas sp. M1-B02 TaxID=3114300 RepID=UPI00223F3843|nr:acyltransferase [Sphingomonas sp. S6-11]UZK67750.1 acyltransferase [Sphingomonas sp. S6-11]
MGQIPALDGFRAIAILIVMVSHAGLGRVIPGGFGVTIFFFLSGYLITTMLRREVAQTGKVNLRAFYLRRSLRIFPPFYITLFLVAAIGVAGLFGEDVHAQFLVWDAFFLSNYAQQIAAYSNVPIPLWSLNVEEHFYIGFSLLFARVFVSMQPRRSATICLSLCAAVLCIRIANVALLDEYSSNYYWSHTRIDSILFGSCLALWNNPVADENPWKPSRAHLLSAIGVLLICFAVRNPVFRETFRYTLQGACLFIVFSAAIQARGFFYTLLNCEVARRVALLSYTLYLAHFPLIALFTYLGVPFAALFGIAASVVYATVMYKMIEKPCGSLRRRLEHRGKSVIAAEPQPKPLTESRGVESIP